MKVMGHPVEHFNVPHPAPEDVEKASAKFEETSAAFQEARAKYHRLVGSRLDDIRAANAAAAAARLDGTAPPKLTPDKIDANIATALAEMDVLFEATDQAGTALVQSVAKHRAGWLATLDAADAEATQRVADLIELQRQATSDVALVRSAARWLRAFTASPSQTQYPGTGGHSVAADFSTLEKIVHGERRLVGYRDGQPLWKTEKVGA